ncbi:hypothetical protein DERP_003830 [Dermatophagoides pteronyssinus]|uniref:Uncharacterized protein n=1 Tax=Dermatophagoides pteronyssinus TaxID=6956 RepID=A0ABQ8JLQ9_DERPT|nr:hypothetical protein DERP_003830 [Dermatophagoides pteronyssinus]
MATFCNLRTASQSLTKATSASPLMVTFWLSRGWIGPLDLLAEESNGGRQLHNAVLGLSVKSGRMND